MTNVTIRLMTLEDYDAVHALWAAEPGIGLHDAEDSREGIAAYLRRNPATCFVAAADGLLVGAVLCGHDGRRGFLNHAVTAPAFRGRGVGRALAESCLSALRAEGIRKAAVLVFRDNDPGNAFWSALGFDSREDLLYQTHRTI
ncbi:MAG: GNAT family N-acetyltransferase [Oscillospiraceae bacterium]|jgi:ribosomal protein S18 acetylase RimI-like enzyme|nr:GNAT family N-acetyltransferase [Oscillospiraceae bacterium]